MIKLNTEFNLKTNIDMYTLAKNAKIEAWRIYNSDAARKDRTFKEIYVSCMVGHAPELYMLNHGFINNPKPYMDVIEVYTGETVEVKATENERNVSYLLKSCNAAAKTAAESNGKYEYGKQLYIWIYNVKSFIYRLYGIYEWNGKQFILQ